MLKISLHCRHPEGQCGHPEQLQPVPHQDDQLGRDHHGRAPEQIRLRIQLQGNLIIFN